MKSILIVLFATISMMCISCNKQAEEKAAFTYDVEVIVPVYEQENVSHYDLEASSDGKTYSAVRRFKASTYLADVYIEVIDIASFITVNGVAFVRAKGVDFDGKITYSGVSKVALE